MTNPYQPSAQSSSAGARSYLWLGMLLAAYVGVYLCRKNLSVAVPLLERDWGLSKESLGMIGSVSTLTYAAGKFLFGPVTDRIGGRKSLRLSMGLVALFGALGAVAPSLIILIVAYSLSRLAGSASWGAMLKLVPEWFSPTKMAFACGLLSLSFVFGGALATAFAGMIAHLSHDSWRSVLGWPSAVLFVLLLLSLFVLPKGPEVPGGAAEIGSTGARRSLNILPLFVERKFVILLALSFTPTLLRETFNFWTVAQDDEQQ